MMKHIVAISAAAIVGLAPLPVSAQTRTVTRKLPYSLCEKVLTNTMTMAGATLELALMTADGTGEVAVDAAMAKAGPFDRLFKEADKNGNGKVSQSEWYSTCPIWSMSMQTTVPVTTQAECDTLWKQAMAGGTGELAMDKAAPYGGMSNFKKVDKDGNGKLSQFEWQNACRQSWFINPASSAAINKEMESTLAAGGWSRVINIALP